MQVASFGFHHPGLAQPRRSDGAQAMQQDGRSGGERLVARLDSDGDGALGVQELQGTRLGRRMDVDRFARLDANGDGALDAGELDDGRGPGRRRGHDHHPHWPGMMESVVRANYADLLAERAAAGVDGAPDVAAQVIERLDGDGSGALNSEELAGTRLAGIIGDGFYGLDADRNGALNRDELGGFLADHLAGAAGPAAAETGAPEAWGVADATPEAPGESGAAEAGAGTEPGSADVTAVAEPEAGVAAQWEAAVDDASASAAARAERIATAFETALEILRGGSGGADPYEVVQALYGDVQNILSA